MPARSGRVPARVLRQADSQHDYQPYLTLNAHRFAGTLIHPVPRSEMLQRFGINERGCKIVLGWPAGTADTEPVRAGDRVEIADQTYEVRGVKSLRGAYVEIYIDEL